MVLTDDAEGCVAVERAGSSARGCGLSRRGPDRRAATAADPPTPAAATKPAEPGRPTGKAGPGARPRTGGAPVAWGCSQGDAVAGQPAGHLEPRRARHDPPAQRPACRLDA